MKYDVETREGITREKGAAKPGERAGQTGCEDRVRFLEGILGNTDDGIIALDHSGTVSYMNPAASRMFGFSSPDEGIKMMRDPAVFEARYSDGRAVPASDVPLARAGRGMDYRDEELIMKRRDTGREFTGSYSSHPVRDESGRLLSSVVTVRDLSGRTGATTRGVTNLPAMLSTIAASIPRVVMANRCDIVLYDEKDRSFTPVEAMWPERETEKGTRREDRMTCISAEDEQLFTRRVMETKKPLIVEDTKENPLCTANRHMIERLGIKSVVVLPLMDREHFLGSMILDSNLSARDFSDQSMDTLNLIARTVSAMIAEAKEREGKPAATAHR
ncbi:GAF domain-containing protein [Methanocella arvoryzae]|nr:GAF domain-containing protein [Methanocella arvoryzae]